MDFFIPTHIMPRTVLISSKKKWYSPVFFFDEMRTVLGIFVRVETDISKVLHCDMEEKGIGIGIGL